MDESSRLQVGEKEPSDRFDVRVCVLEHCGFAEGVAGALYVGVNPPHHAQSACRRRATAAVQGQVATNTDVVLINGTDVHTRGVVVDIHAAKMQIRPGSESGTLRGLGSRRNHHDEPFTQAL